MVSFLANPLLVPTAPTIAEQKTSAGDARKIFKDVCILDVFVVHEGEINDGT